MSSASSQMFQAVSVLKEILEAQRRHFKDHLFYPKQHAYRHVFPAKHSVRCSISPILVDLTPSLSGQSCSSSMGTRACTLLSRKHGCKHTFGVTVIHFRDYQRSDYSGLAILKTITSTRGEGIHRLTRFWACGNVS